MSGIINSVGSKSGVIGKKELSVIRWRLKGDPGTGALTTLGHTSDWILSDTISENPVEFAVGYTQSRTLVTEASGIFSFAETGYYYIDSHITCRQQTGDTLWIRCYHMLSDNGSAGTFNVVTSTYTSQVDNGYSNIPQASLVKVDDVTNDKFMLQVATQAPTTIWQYENNAGYNTTYIDFIKLGEL